MYKLIYLGDQWSKPWIIAKKVSGFWQQISPNYLHKKSAITFANRKNLTLIK